MNKSNPPISLKEHLSSVLDDEAGLFEQRRVLDELKSDEILRSKLSYYALIGETMRSGELPKQSLTACSSFLSAIHQQIDNDETYHHIELQDKQQNSLAGNSVSWLKPVGGLALAASVAAIAVLGVQNYSQNNVNLQDAGIAATELAPAAKPVSVTVAVANNDNNNQESGDGYQQADAQTRSLLKRYVDSHMQYASTSAFMPSVRVIAYAD